MICSCCDEKIVGESIKKYKFILCEKCSIKVFDKMQIVEGTLSSIIKKIQE